MQGINEIIKAKKEDNREVIMMNIDIIVEQLIEKVVGTDTREICYDFYSGISNIN